jgi:hypothetical protein
MLPRTVEDFKERLKDEPAPGAPLARALRQGCIDTAEACGLWIRKRIA